MNKMDLIDQVAAKTGSTKKNAAQSVEAVLKTLTEALSSGEKVQLMGFGSFTVRKRKAHKGCNPQTGAAVDVPARKAPTFSAGITLKEIVNSK